MFPLILAIFASISMSRLAESDGNPGPLWGGITFIACFACILLMPGLPFLNVGIGCILAFVLMTVTNK